jgi:hypothetical protein
MSTEQADTQGHVPRGCKPFLPLWMTVSFRSTAGHRRRTHRFASGGACRDRTDDPLLAKQVLSQLS